MMIIPVACIGVSINRWEQIILPSQHAQLYGRHD